MRAVTLKVIALAHRFNISFNNKCKRNYQNTDELTIVISCRGGDCGVGKGKDMEKYINNIVVDMINYMKTAEATPEEAREHVMDVVEEDLAVKPRIQCYNAESFVRDALRDIELYKIACDYVDDYRYKRVVLNDAWYELDAELYSAVCMIKKDEIIKRVKELESIRGDIAILRDELKQRK